MPPRRKGQPPTKSYSLRNNPFAPLANEQDDPPGTEGGNPQDGLVENEVRNPQVQSTRRSRGTSSPLSSIPPIPDDRRNGLDSQPQERGDDRSSPHQSHTPSHRSDNRGNLIDELADLVDNAHERYEAVHEQLVGCVDMQQNLAQRLNDLQSETRREQRDLVAAFQRIRDRHQLGNDEPRRRTRANRSPVMARYNDIPYEDTRDTVERANLMLFAPRADEESSTAYDRRESAQLLYLAREQYERDREKRNRAAEEWARSVGLQARQDGQPPDDDPSDSSPTPRNNRDDQRGRGNGRRDQGRDNRDPHRPRQGPQARRAGNGGPPDGSSGSSSSNDDHTSSRRSRDNRRERSRSSDQPSQHENARARRPADPTAQRTTTRSPTYFRDEYVGPTAQEPSDPNADFVEAQLRIIRKAIKRRVGKAKPDVPALKGLKNVPSPEKEKYDGKDDAELFMSWLKQLLRWMEISQVVGPDLDETRVGLIGLFVTGPAREWYDEIVDNVLGDGTDWSFSDAVCKMYKRFIHRSTARAAAEQFETVKYDREGGVSALWEALLKWARKMAHWPDDYTFNRRFVNALPEEISIPVFKNRNVSLEKSPPSLLKRVALEQEENNRVVEEVRSSHRKQYRPVDTANNNARMSGQGRDQPQSTGYRSRAQNGRVSTRGTRYGNNDRPSQHGATGTSDRPNATSGTPSAGPSRPVNVVSSSRPNITSNVMATTSQGSRPIRCYNCQAEGHIASNCPRPRVAHNRAARVVDNETAEVPREHEPEISETATHIVKEVSPESYDENMVHNETYTENVDECPDDELAVQLDEQYHAFGGSQYDPDADHSEEYYSEEEENHVYFGMMRRQSTHENGESDSSDEDIPGPSGYNHIADDFDGPRPRPVEDILSEGSSLGLSIFVAARRRLAELSPGSEDRSDSANPPPLVPARTSMPTEGDTTDEDGDSEANDLEHQWNAQVGEAQQEIESPLASTALAAWAEYISSDHGELEFQRLRALYFQLIGANQYLTAERSRDHETYRERHHQFNQVQDELLETREERNRIHAHLAWTRRELGLAIERERSTLNALNSLILNRAEALNEVVQHIRTREQILSNPMDPELTDNELEGDYLDDPSMSTANDVLQRAITRPEADPPAYGGPARTREPSMRAMTVTEMSVIPPTVPANMTTRARVGRRPITRRIDQTCLSFMMRVNGLDALVLLDSGSTGDSISPDFARVCGARTYELENPATLQLGCVGSRSRINYGTRVPIRIGESEMEIYLDVVNLDRYDVVLGTPFMRRFGVQLNFENGTVVIQGSLYAALTPREEEHQANRRRSRRTGSAEQTSRQGSAMRANEAGASE